LNPKSVLTTAHLCESGDLFHSRIDAKNGLLSITPEDPNLKYKKKLNGKGKKMGHILFKVGQ